MIFQITLSMSIRFSFQRFKRKFLTSLVASEYNTISKSNRFIRKLEFFHIWSPFKYNLRLSTRSVVRTI